MDLLKMLKECRNDLQADGMDMGDDSVAYEIAASLLEDPKVLKAAKAMWPGKSKDILQEMIADRL